ncbi:MAG: cupredoxin domain-containing protein [Clostridiales bacterium]|nr:cupredoxin domain-containing protein [Clostridiales bacterium]
MFPKQLHVPVLVAIAAALVGVIVMLVADPGTPESVKQPDAAISRVMTNAETDTSADFPVRLLEGSDIQHESVHMFEALMGIEGVGTATLDPEGLVLNVAYDSTVVSEDSIRAELIASRYLAVTSADATPMELAADGAVQRIGIVDKQGFEPAYILAKAGVPLELAFGPATDCRTNIKFPQLGVAEDISSGATVKLPALQPGTYDIVCGGDGKKGAIIVE